jgi:predicted LPLAT superfamily acyltransferase
VIICPMNSVLGDKSEIRNFLTNLFRMMFLMAVASFPFAQFLVGKIRNNVQLYNGGKLDISSLSKR